MMFYCTNNQSLRYFVKDFTKDTKRVFGTL